VRGDVHICHLREGDGAGLGFRGIGICLGLLGVALGQRVAAYAHHHMQLVRSRPGCRELHRGAPGRRTETHLAHLSAVRVSEQPELGVA